eukprot:Skav203407  [mRNA]  locus=scaffold1743:183284:200111:- [translate_table: standard]
MAPGSLPQAGATDGEVGECHLCSDEVRHQQLALSFDERAPPSGASRAKKCAFTWMAISKVKGIVHAAGTLADGLIKDMTLENLELVCSAKEMWLFSSVAAMIGSVAQGEPRDPLAPRGTPWETGQNVSGNYCAANAFMDTFGARRRAKQLPAVSLQWGPWAEVGMAARSIARLDLTRGLEAMALVLGAREVLSKFGGSVGGKKAAAAAGAIAPWHLGQPRLDSLAGVEFRNRLQASFEGLTLCLGSVGFKPKQFINGDGWLMDRSMAVDVGPAEDELGGAGGAGVVMDAGAMLAIAPWPSLEMWRAMDTTTELPPERWDMDAYYDADVDAPGHLTWLAAGKTYVRLGIEHFDGDFFGVSEAELRAMDPHQHLGQRFSGGPRGWAVDDSLQGMDCGVFVCCCNLGGNDVDPEGSGAESQRVGFSKMRGLAFDGRCKTFDSSADGFARGEGIGSVWVTRGSAEKTGENELVTWLGWVGWVSLTGVAINHDGRAATITAPNGTAQQRVLRSALAERQTQGEDVTCIECHGTGTEPPWAIPSRWVHSVRSTAKARAAWGQEDGWFGMPKQAIQQEVVVEGYKDGAST